MTASFLQDVQTSTRERVALPAGSYGTSKEPGLKILMYSEKGSKLDKTGAMQHSFLVAATRPSREMKAAAAPTNGGGGTFPNEPDFEGTAFLKVVLHEMWMNPEATALAFTENSRNKEGVVQADYVSAAIQKGDTTQEAIDKAVDYFRKATTDKLIENNTPTEQLEEKVEEQYRKDLKTISIKVGQFIDLQDWAGVPRDLHFDPTKLVNVEFSGKVESKEFNGKTGSEVSAVYGKAKQK